jgi:hypothetical protein
MQLPIQRGPDHLVEPDEKRSGRHDHHAGADGHYRRKSWPGELFAKPGAAAKASLRHRPADTWGLGSCRSAPPMNSKPLVLSLANAALYLVTCALIGTGLLLELRMDDEDGSVQLLGMAQDDWGEIHLAIAISFVALAVLHLLLNRGWIKALVTKAGWAVPLLAGGLGLVAALLFWPTEREAAPNGNKAKHHQKDAD